MSMMIYSKPGEQEFVEFRHPEHQVSIVAQQGGGDLWFVYRVPHGKRGFVTTLYGNADKDAAVAFATTASANLAASMNLTPPKQRKEDTNLDTPKDQSRAYAIATLILREHAFAGFEFTAGSQEELAKLTINDNAAKELALWHQDNHDIGLNIHHHPMAGRKSEIGITARLFKEAATSAKPFPPGDSWWDSAKRTNVQLVRDFMTGTYPMLREYWDRGAATRAANISEHTANCAFLDRMATAGNGTARHAPYSTEQGSVVQHVQCYGGDSLWTLSYIHGDYAKLAINCTRAEALAIVAMLASRRQQTKETTP